MQGYLVSARGQPVGKLVDTYFDDADWRVRYFVAETADTSSRQGLWFSTAVAATPDDAGEEFPVNLTRAQLDQTSITNAEAKDADPAWTKLHDDHGWPHCWLAPILGDQDGPVAYTDPAGPPPAGIAQDGVDAQLRSTNEIRGYVIEGRDGPAGHVCGFLCEDREWSIRYLVGTAGSGANDSVYVDPETIRNVDRARSVVEVDMPVAQIHEMSRHDPPGDE
jgi:hypothetical protein